MGSLGLRFSRRCIAVDLGQSRIKAILAERTGNRVEVLHAFTLDLQEEGLLTPEEANRHINRILLEMGDYPLSLVIPQHIAVSHLIALPSEGTGRWERLIEGETQKLTGLSESAIVYDYFRLKPFPRNRNPVWVTVSRERELDFQIKRLGGSGLVVGEVTNTGNALASAYLATQSPEERVVLVDVGAASTTLVVLDGYQPVYATSIPFGGEMFTEAVSVVKGTGFDDAEIWKKQEFLFEGEAAVPEYVEAVDRWRGELEKAVGEWLKDQPEAEAEPLKIMLSGGASLQSGFVEHLQEKSSFCYDRWTDSACGVDPRTYSVAYGAALAGLKVAPVSTSLLPKVLRQERFRAKQVAAFNSLAGLLLLVLFGLLLWDASSKRQALRERQERLADLNDAHVQSQLVTELLAEKNLQYEKTVPIVQQQKRTRDLLKTIGLMQEVRAEHEAWFVLLADGRSYQEEAAFSPSGGTGSGPSRSEMRGRGILDSGGRNGEESRAAADWNRFVVEISMPGTGRDVHDMLRGVVNTFAARPIYRNVDTLAASDRKQIVDPDVTLPDQTFSLNLELVPGDFSSAVRAAAGFSDEP